MDHFNNELEKKTKKSKFSHVLPILIIIYNNRQKKEKDKDNKDKQ